jgi:ribosomal protein S14
MVSTLEKAKKVTQCFSCGSLNGVVKKCGLLKISHEKYRQVAQNGGALPLTELLRLYAH